MEFKEAQALLREGIRPSPEYPDLPNDYTAEELIAYDPKAELEYRMAKDQNPAMTRTMILQHWRSYKIGQWGRKKNGGAAAHEDSLFGGLRKAAERLIKRRDDE